MFEFLFVLGGEFFVLGLQQNVLFFDFAVLHSHTLGLLQEGIKRA